jgi:hypothetical protein
VRGFLLEMWAFMKERRKLWLLPLVLLMLALGVLLVLTESSVVAPFIYSLF